MSQPRLLPVDCDASEVLARQISNTVEALRTQGMTLPEAERCLARTFARFLADRATEGSEPVEHVLARFDANFMGRLHERGRAVSPSRPEPGHKKRDRALKQHSDRATKTARPRFSCFPLWMVPA